MTSSLFPEIYYCQQAAKPFPQGTNTKTLHEHKTRGVLEKGRGNNRKYSVHRPQKSNLQELNIVFTKLQGAVPKGKLSKCAFLKSRIEHLCHVVDEDGIRTVDTKINAVKNFPTPQNVGTVRSFLDLAGYYRAFVRNFAANTSPFTLIERHVFESLKHALTHTPILAFPYYTLPFTLCNDASALGVGTILMQSFDGQRPHVVVYAGRTLNTAESKYSVTHMEVLVVV